MCPAYSVEAQTPWVHSLLCQNSTRDSRRSKIISHIRPGTGPVQFGAVRCRQVWLIVTPIFTYLSFISLLQHCFYIKVISHFIHLYDHIKTYQICHSQSMIVIMLYQTHEHFLKIWQKSTSIYMGVTKHRSTRIALKYS